MQKNQLKAILEIGSTGVRLLIAEIDAGDSLKVMDRANKPLSLGRDVFTGGVVSRESFLECISVLQGFRELIEGWRVAPEHIHVLATSALRAAGNRDVFVDRIFRETGFRIEIIEGIEENRLMYLAVRYALKNDLPAFWRANSMIIEVGGGSTEIMLLRRGKMVSAHSIALGTILADQQYRLALGSGTFREQYFAEKVRNTIEAIRIDMELGYVRTIVASGADARFAAEQAGEVYNSLCRIIGRDNFLRFTEKVRSYSVEECVQKLNMPYQDAESLVPSLLVYKLFLEQSSAASVIVPLTTIREGMLIDLVSGVDAELQEDFYSQVIASACNLGRKFHYDEAHNLHVAKLSLALFDALLHEHGMSRRDKLLLEVAGILHDVGTFIAARDHQRHSQYIVSHSEIFGLHQEDIDIVSNVIGSHRGPPPQETDITYIALQREDRMRVLKMVSMLRVADALDRRHSQHIQTIEVERRRDTLMIRVPQDCGTEIERLSLADKSDMFLDIFGFKVVIG